MEFIHQTRYGHAGGFHTARPVMAYDREKGHFYDVKNGVADTSKAIYEVRGSRVYATKHHPDGEAAHASFEIRGDKIHTTEHHPAHNPSSHIFELKKSLG